MGYLTTKYKGKYRLKCEVDKVTNDFPETLKDTYEDADVYIDCSFGNKIFYYGKGILQSYIPSLQRGRNIIRKLYTENINPENVSILKSGKGTTYKIIDHKQFNSDIKNSKFIFDILETNSEVMFKFYEKNSDKIIPLLKPKTSGADISPFKVINEVINEMVKEKILEVKKYGKYKNNRKSKHDKHGKKSGKISQSK